MDARLRTWFLGIVATRWSPHVAAYLGRVLHHWISFWGSVSVAIVGIVFGVLGRAIPAILFAVLAIMFVSVAQYRAYRESQVQNEHKLSALTTDLDQARVVISGHEERLRPKLRFHFAGRVDPYYSELGLVDPNGGGGILQRVFRVALINDSTAEIPGVEVQLQSCSNLQGGTFIGHRLSFMGRSNEVETVRVGPNPSLFVNVVAQNLSEDRPDQNHAFFYYARPNLMTPIGDLRRTLTLAAYGAGPPAEISFDLMFGSDGAIQLTELVKP